MQISKQPIYQFLEGSGKSFVIPVQLVVGHKDIKAREVSVKTREGKGKVKLEELKGYLVECNF